jgi:hypothetical protein
VDQPYKLKHKQTADLRIQPPGIVALARYGGKEFQA